MIASSHALVLLGLAEDRIPNQDALALSPAAGWIMLFCALCAATILIVHREGWRRLWLRREDPRTMGLFRIAFGLCAMGNINGLWELFDYLFTDEGLFLTDVAREVFAREQFAGFGNGLDGDPFGFVSPSAMWEWLKGPKYSLLFFWDTPTAFWIHLAAFEIAMICLIIGLWTDYIKWIAWFLFHSIILRNTVFWEGTENIYRTFFFYLCLSRCGHAYSVDNWLRCRKLRARGRLSEPGKPGEGAGAPPSVEHPDGLEAIYRRIPAWPRMLVILQVAAIYISTGVVKNGPVWWRGDAFYYALNLDHFYRFPPQQLSAWFGTNLFRVNTHIVHMWESFYPVVVLGLVVRFGLRERLPRLPNRELWIQRLAWMGLGLGAGALAVYLYPVHYNDTPRGDIVAELHTWLREPTRKHLTIQLVQLFFGLGWILGMVLVAWLHYRLRYNPFRLTLRKHTFTLDLDWFCRWFFGRRVWVFLGIVFHLHLTILMSIGWFQPGALTGFICYFNGTEVALVLAIFWRALAKVTKLGPRPRPALPPEDPTLPHQRRDNVRFPVWGMVLAVAYALAGIVLEVADVLVFGWTLIGIGLTLLVARLPGWPRWAVVVVPIGWALHYFGEQQNSIAFLHFKWTLLAMGVYTLAVTLFGPAPQPSSNIEIDPSPKRLNLTALTEPWAYGPFGRFFVNCLVLYHIVGVAVWLMPDKDSFGKWRIQTHEPFRFWLDTTHTTQGWGMFAPNPPRANMFLRVLVTDQSGETWDMNQDVYSPQSRPIPWIWYTRQRKINRRIGGGEGGHGSWYQKWHARYFCRKWALEHGGEEPKKIELIKITYPIPSPAEVARTGPYDPMKRLEELANQSSILSIECAKEIDGQLPNVIRERHGLPPLATEMRRWSRLRGRKDAWERRLRHEERKREREREERRHVIQEGEE